MLPQLVNIEHGVWHKVRGTGKIARPFSWVIDVYHSNDVVIPMSTGHTQNGKLCACNV